MDSVHITLQREMGSLSLNVEKNSKTLYNLKFLIKSSLELVAYAAA